MTNPSMMMKLITNSLRSPVSSSSSFISCPMTTSNYKCLLQRQSSQYMHYYYQYHHYHHWSTRRISKFQWSLLCNTNNQTYNNISIISSYTRKLYDYNDDGTTSINKSSHFIAARRRSYTTSAHHHHHKKKHHYKHYHISLLRSMVTDTTTTTKITKKNIETNDLKPSTMTSTTSTSASSTVLLYQRNPSRSFFPRLLLSISTLHTGYWTWYVFDYTPSLQQHMPTMDIIVDPTLGYVGLGLAIFMNIGACIYPTSLIQEIRLKTKTRNNNNNANSPPLPLSSSLLLTPSSILEIKTYSLPFLSSSSSSSFFSSKPLQYELGNVIIDSPNDVKKIITDYKNDITLFDTYLPLHAQGLYVNLLLHIQSSSSSSSDSENKKNHNDDFIPNKDILFNALVSPHLRNVIDSNNGVSRGSSSSSSGVDKKKILYSNLSHGDNNSGNTLQFKKLKKRKRKK